MTEQTRHMIALEIRHMKGLLTAQEEWARRHSGVLRRESVYRIAFWRVVLKDAELRLAFAEDVEVDAGTDRITGK